MTRRQRLLALALGLVALLGAGLWSLPRLLDWNAQRPRVAALVGERLGREVAINGPLALVLLPEPRLEAYDVAMARGPDGIGGEARSLRLRLALGPLLLGRIAVREVALVGAEIRLPWPPPAVPGLAPPPWLAALDARVEDSRVLLGDRAAVEGVTARVTAGGPAEAVRAEGGFRWRDTPIAFEASLGRAGDDGIAPLDLTLRGAGATAQARGILLAEGGFEGRFDGQGPDLAALLPAPPGPFRARGTLRAGGELVAADALALDLPAGSLRGAASLRLVPEPRADISLAAARLDLEPWLAALRGAGARVVPLALDLSAETAELGPLRLRRLRGGAWLEDGRLMLADVAADLPGGAQAELSGATAGARLDMRLRLRAARPRELAASLGLPAAVPIPSEAAEGTANLSVEGQTLAATDIALRFGGGNRVAGGVTWRGGGPRPSLALGLEADSLRLEASGAEALRGAAERADLSLRLAASRVALPSGLEWRRVALDAGAEAGRIVLRSLAAERDGAEFQLSGALTPGAPPRLADAALEARGAAGAVLAPLLGAPVVQGPAALLPLRLRATAQGPLDAARFRAEAELGDARLEAEGTANPEARRGAGTLTLRHPGATRLLEGFGLAAPWIGPGSLSVIANLAADLPAASFQAESLELVAGEARLRVAPGGALTLAGDGPARLSARVQAEHLPLPPPGALLAPPRGLEAEVSLAAQRVALPGDLPPLEEASAELRLAPSGALRVGGLRARVAGGALEGALALEPGAPPTLAAEFRLADAVLPGPLSGGVPDLSAGRVTAEARLRAEGASPETLLATLSGEARAEARGGALGGLDLLAAARALSLADPPEAEAALRRAFAGGATAFEALSLRLSLANGEARVEEGALSVEGGLSAAISGALDLARGTQSLRVALRPPEGPEVALRLHGPRAAPRRTEEVGDWLRWLSSR